MPAPMPGASKRIGVSSLPQGASCSTLPGAQILGRRLALDDLRVTFRWRQLRTFHPNGSLSLNPNPTLTSQMKLIPMISSGIAGPLGVLHLPRLWQKASLAAVGRLHDDYPGCGKGYDNMVLEGLGLDREAFLSFIKDRKPTYPECEAWVLSQKGGSLDAEAVRKLNGAIAGYIHDDATRKAILSESNIEDSGAIRDAVNLNNLDDWKAFHRDVLA